MRVVSCHKLCLYIDFVILDWYYICREGEPSETITGRRPGHLGRSPIPLNVTANVQHISLWPWMFIVDINQIYIKLYGRSLPLLRAKKNWKKKKREEKKKLFSKSDSRRNTHYSHLRYNKSRRKYWTIWAPARMIFCSYIAVPCCVLRKFYSSLESGGFIMSVALSQRYHPNATKSQVDFLQHIQLFCTVHCSRCLSPLYRSLK